MSSLLKNFTHTNSSSNSNNKLVPNNTINSSNYNSNNNNNGMERNFGVTPLINDHAIVYSSTSLSMPNSKQTSSSDDPELKKKLKILKKEYLKQKAELERLAQIALCQQEELKQKEYQIKKYKQQCEEQGVKLSEYESQLQIERELCEGAIRMKKSQQGNVKDVNINEKPNERSNQPLSDNDLSLLLLDEGLTTMDIMEKTYKYLQDDTYTFMLNTDEYQEEETISSLKQEIATLREENFTLREEKHKLNIEKVHLYELVHDLNQNYLRSQQQPNNNN